MPLRGFVGGSGSKIQGGFACWRVNAQTAENVQNAKNIAQKQPMLTKASISTIVSIVAAGPMVSVCFQRTNWLYRSHHLALAPSQPQRQKPLKPRMISSTTEELCIVLLRCATGVASRTKRSGCQKPPAPLCVVT